MDFEVPIFKQCHIGFVKRDWTINLEGYLSSFFGHVLAS